MSDIEPCELLQNVGAECELLATEAEARADDAPPGVPAGLEDPLPDEEGRRIGPPPATEGLRPAAPRLPLRLRLLASRPAAVSDDGQAARWAAYWQRLEELPTRYNAGMGSLLYLLAVVLFAVAGFDGGVTSEAGDLTAFGLCFFAAGHLVPDAWLWAGPRNRS